MNDVAHIIEIDRIVLTGVTQYRADRLHSLIEAEVQRVLSSAGISQGVTAPNTEIRVAGEVARSVVQMVRSGET
jgi:hypothetical protein